MQSNLVSFIQVLRTHDVRISPAETLDAMDAVKTLGYADRSLLRDGLAMTLAKTPEEEAVFLQCFGRFFSHAKSVQIYFFIGGAEHGDRFTDRHDGTLLH